MTDPVSELAVRRVALERRANRLVHDLEKVLHDYVRLREDLGEDLLERVPTVDVAEVTAAYGDDVVRFWDLEAALLAIADRVIDVVDPPLPRPDTLDFAGADRFVVAARPETTVEAGLNGFLAELLGDAGAS